MKKKVRTDGAPGGMDNEVKFRQGEEEEGGSPARARGGSGEKEGGAM